MRNIWDLLADHEPGNSDYQDVWLVTVRAGGTAYGMYKQTLRELYRRARGLREMLADRELMALDIEEQEEKAGSDGREGKRAQVEVARLRARMEEAERAIRATTRELQTFLGLAQELKRAIGDLSPERRWALERELWDYRVRAMALGDIVAHGRLSAETIEHIHALPERDAILNDVRSGALEQKVMAVLKQRDALIQQMNLLEARDEDPQVSLQRVLDAMGEDSVGYVFERDVPGPDDDH